MPNNTQPFADSSLSSDNASRTGAKSAGSKATVRTEGPLPMRPAQPSADEAPKSEQPSRKRSTSFGPQGNRRERPRRTTTPAHRTQARCLRSGEEGSQDES